MVYDGNDKKLRRPVAVKVYEKKKLQTDEKRQFIQNEVDVMSKLVHKNIAK